MPCGDHAPNPPSPTPTNSSFLGSDRYNLLTRSCEKPHKTKGYTFHSILYTTLQGWNLTLFLAGMTGADSEADALWFPPSHIGIKQLNVCVI